MSEEMAVGDSVSNDDAKVNGVEAVASAGQSQEPDVEQPPKLEKADPEETAPLAEDGPSEKSDATSPEPASQERGVKRRASIAFSDDSADFRGFDDGAPAEDEFKGFEDKADKDVSHDYSRVLDRLEAEVTAAAASYTPLRTVMAAAMLRASKRPRTDTDASRPSSAMSSRSDSEGVSNEGSSPGPRRRATTEMSSPLLRAPLERGWRRELVYRAALDQHSRRQADIYYYTPRGKKLRSTREVSEHLAGTGFTLENFSFCKEPLGVDDPEKEIIRDAKLMRRVESPVSAPAPVEGKRAPKPRPPKGASPEPVRSPPAKIRVKSVGSRLSNSGAAPAPAPPKQQKKAADNNNSAAWKKPRPHAPPPPLQSRPPPAPPDLQSPRQVLQPCSMTCGRGVPTLACAACLCLYHPQCVDVILPAPNFQCKNCRTSSSPPREPPPLIHKSGVGVANVGVAPVGVASVGVAGVGAAPIAPVPRKPAPRPLVTPAPAPVPDKRVLLRMKVRAGGPDGSRVWAVSAPPRAPAPRPALRAQLPQSLAVLNGRKFIVVPRSAIQPPAGQ